MIQVVQQGLLDTVQDAGRYGYQHLGINPGGVMDKVAFQVANNLVGNEPATPVIELHFPAAAFLFETDTMIALSGADFGAMVNDQPIEINQPIWVSRLAILRFTRPVAGARCYLAVRGGLALTPWLGSCSTHLKAGAGGFEGRKLLRNDHLPVNEIETIPAFVRLLIEDKALFSFPWRAGVADLYTDPSSIRVVPGPEWGRLTHAAKATFTEQAFALTEHCDRMGYRLKGPVIHTNTRQDQLSAGITRGTVQLLPDGQLIILMADHQTTGGYPRIAHVITADLPGMAQLLPHDKLHFSVIDHETAENLLWEQEQRLLFLQNACNLRWQDWLQDNHH